MVPVILMVLALFTQGQSATVRLSGGQGPWEGRLEIFHNGSWGTVCDDQFGLNDAKVVCHMLGFQRAISVFGSSRFHSGDGQIMLTNIRCTGHEDDIVNCPSNQWYRNTCQHNEDVGLNCVREGSEPVEGVRLIGGTGPYEGTVELKVNGVWGTICDDEFGINDAQTICKMAGYPRALQAFSQAHFGHGNGSILLSNLRCTGHETNVDFCASQGWYKHTCTHVEDAGVACLGNQREQTVQDVRLIGGSGPYEGTIELKVNGVWGTVCDDYFDIKDGNVMCRMAGYPRALQTFQKAHFGQGNGSILLSNLKCTGYEKIVDNCGSGGWYNTNCAHGEDAGVACLDVRLVGGSGPYEGTIEININGVWGTVCDDYFDIKDGNVICRMAGYPRALQTFQQAHFGQGNGSSILTHLQCTGNENSIDNCGSGGWYMSNCNHGEDAGVACLGNQREETVQGNVYNITGVRLVGGSGPYEGTIELNINGVWGTVCDDYFDIHDGNVICRMAGYPRAIQTFQQAHFGQGNGSIILTNLQCTGHENSVDNCGSGGWYMSNCNHGEDAGVACLGDQRKETVQDVRLVGGSGPYEGTIELNINGVWGTVCDDYFDIKDGNVICRMAGYPRAIQTFGKAHFGRGKDSTTSMVTNLGCSGFEDSLESCSSAGWYNSQCGHSEDAGVECLASNRSHIIEGVKLVGGAWPWEGRVELLVNGEWGTICNDNFDVNDAKVICTMAGYSPTGHIQAFANNHFGHGKGNILLNNLQCQGFETNIENCTSSGWYNNKCGHNGDVGVSCLDNVPAIG